MWYFQLLWVDKLNPLPGVDHLFALVLLSTYMNELVQKNFKSYTMRYPHFCCQFHWFATVEWNTVPTLIHSLIKSTSCAKLLIGHVHFASLNPRRNIFWRVWIVLRSIHLSTDRLACSSCLPKPRRLVILKHNYFLHFPYLVIRDPVWSCSNQVHFCAAETENNHVFYCMLYCMYTYVSPCLIAI